MALFLGRYGSLPPPRPCARATEMQTRFPPQSLFPQRSNSPIAVRSDPWTLSHPPGSRQLMRFMLPAFLPQWGYLASTISTMGATGRIPFLSGGPRAVFAREATQALWVCLAIALPSRRIAESLSRLPASILGAVGGQGVRGEAPTPTLTGLSCKSALHTLARFLQCLAGSEPMNLGENPACPRFTRTQAQGVQKSLGAWTLARFAV